MPVIFSLNIAVLREINRMVSVAPSAPAGGGSDGKKGGGDDASAALQKRFAVLTLCASAAFVICNTPLLVRYRVLSDLQFSSNLFKLKLITLHVSLCLIDELLYYLHYA